MIRIESLLQAVVGEMGGYTMNEVWKTHMNCHKSDLFETAKLRRTRCGFCKAEKELLDLILK